MNWYRIPAGKGVAGIQSIQSISNAIMMLILTEVRKGNDVSDVALFWWHDFEPDEHYAYFPPSSEEIGRDWKGAEPSSPPPMDGHLSLEIAGNSGRAWTQITGV